MGIDQDKRLLTATVELRRQAEERLQAKNGGGHPPRTDAEALRLFHELEVHQIELEIQNEELSQVRHELETALTASKEREEQSAHLASFPQMNPNPVLELDSSGTINFSNPATLKVLSDLGLDAADVAVFLPADMASLLAGWENANEKTYYREVAVKERTFAETIFLSPQYKVARIYVYDVTARKRAEEELLNERRLLESRVRERTRELFAANEQLSQEIVERKKGEESLQNAYVKISEMKERLKAENVYLQQEVAREHDFSEIMGQSLSLSTVLGRVEQVAPMHATVLLLGETGTGKGMIARALHSHSARKDRALITVNCSALPANLIESELFGREKGAFTGAASRQIGRFELADGGTIFLDEIGDLPLELQGKLLRVIQEGEFERLGSPRTIKVDVRIIAATNRKLEEEIRNGRFREDLFFRLNVFPITIPPLRERKDDIPILVAHFVAKFNQKNGKKIETVSNETLKTLQEYHWPGNVRELESVIERAVITSSGSTLQILDRFNLFRKNAEHLEAEVKALDHMERDHILQVLKKTGWRVEGKKGAAILLDINPSTLRSRMLKLGIIRE